MFSSRFAPMHSLKIYKRITFFTSAIILYSLRPSANRQRRIQTSCRRYVDGPGADFVVVVLLQALRLQRFARVLLRGRQIGPSQVGHRPSHGPSPGNLQQMGLREGSMEGIEIF